MQIWLYTQLGLDILYFRVQIKSLMSHFKITEMTELHVKEPLYIFFYNMKVMFEFCKFLTLWSFVNGKFCKVMYNTSHYSINADSSKC